MKRKEKTWQDNCREDILKILEDMATIRCSDDMIGMFYESEYVGEDIAYRITKYIEENQ